MNSDSPSATRDPSPRKHRGSAHDASHQPWEYGKHAAFWATETLPLAANLIPAATEMHAWLSRKAPGLSAPATYRSADVEAQRNPYTLSLATLAGSLAMAVNEAAAFASSTEEINPAEAEIRRIRLESELILYAARFSEAAIKQMLHCTDFPPKLYERAALGALLEQDCKACRHANSPTHSFSLFGSLAHQYFLCHETDACALDHLISANRRRNAEVAHASAQPIQNIDTVQSRRLMAQKVDSVVGEFAHLLSHISKIETAMIREIELRILHYPQMPPMDAYNTFLTRTASDYNSEGVYQHFGYGLERKQMLKAQADRKES